MARPGNTAFVFKTTLINKKRVVFGKMNDVAYTRGNDSDFLVFLYIFTKGRPGYADEWNDKVPVSPQMTGDWENIWNIDSNLQDRHSLSNLGTLSDDQSRSYNFKAFYHKSLADRTVLIGPCKCCKDKPGYNLELNTVCDMLRACLDRFW